MLRAFALSMMLAGTLAGCTQLDPATDLDDEATSAQSSDEGAGERVQDHVPVVDRPMTLLFRHGGGMDHFGMHSILVNVTTDVELTYALTSDERETAVSPHLAVLIPEHPSATTCTPGTPERSYLYDQHDTLAGPVPAGRYHIAVIGGNGLLYLHFGGGGDVHVARDDGRAAFFAEFHGNSFPFEPTRTTWSLEADRPWFAWASNHLFPWTTPDGEPLPATDGGHEAEATAACASTVEARDATAAAAHSVWAAAMGPPGLVELATDYRPLVPQPALVRLQFTYAFVVQVPA